MVKKTYYWTIIPSLIGFMVTQQLAEIKAESGFGYCKKGKSFRKTLRTVRKSQKKQYRNGKRYPDPDRRRGCLHIPHKCRNFRVCNSVTPP